jgi:hypothetical protein
MIAPWDCSPALPRPMMPLGPDISGRRPARRHGGEELAVPGARRAPPAYRARPEPADQRAGNPRPRRAHGRARRTGRATAPGRPGRPPRTRRVHRDGLGPPHRERLGRLHRRPQPEQGKSLTASPLSSALRAGADGLYALEAATGLVIAHGSRLIRDDFARFIHHGSGTAAIDWAAAMTPLDEGGLPGSGGERRMLELAASLAGHRPVILGDAIPGIDDRSLGTLVKAVLHASGQRQFPSPRLPRHAPAGASVRACHPGGISTQRLSATSTMN